jgi:putative protease
MEQRIGEVTHYYNRIGVAVLRIEDGLNVGDSLHIVGHTTDFSQQVNSMEVEHREMQAVGAGADVALKVDERVRVGDVIYRVVDDRVTHF